MRMKVLLGERVMVLPDESELKTPSGLIIPDVVKIRNTNLKQGVVTKKGTGTPWNRMEDVHVKQVVMWRRGAGTPYEEEDNGHAAKYLILNYSELLFT